MVTGGGGKLRIGSRLGEETAGRLKKFLVPLTPTDHGRQYAVAYLGSDAVRPIVTACPASTAAAAGCGQQPEPETRPDFPGKRWIAEIFAGELCEYLVPVRPASLLVTRQSIRPGSQTPLSRQHPILEPSIRSNRLTRETRLPLRGEKNSSFDQCSSLPQNLIAGDSLDRAIVEFHCSALGFN